MCELIFISWCAKHTPTPNFISVSRQRRYGKDSVQLSSVTELYPTLCDPMDCSMPGFSVHHQLPELTQTHVHWVGDAIQPSHPLASPSPPTFNLSQHEGLSNELTLHLSWPNFWSFIFSTHTSNEYSGLIFFRIDWFDLLDVQETLKSFSSTTVQRHQFFGAQPFLFSSSPIHSRLLEKLLLWLYRPL